MAFPGRWPVCIQLYGHGAEAPIDGYCIRILAFRGLSACQGSLNSSKIVVNEMVLTCLKCPWIQCFQGIIRFWLDFYVKKAKNTAAWGCGALCLIMDIICYILCKDLRLHVSSDLQTVKLSYHGLQSRR